MNGKIDVILAAQRAADGLTRTLASVLMQANAPFAVTVVAAEDAPLPFAAENARLLRGQGDLLALWRAGLEACEGEWALLLHAGDALFDAYSLWRLADAQRENPQAAAVYGAARCFGPDGREARGVDFRALPCGVLARRETLLTALARAKTPFALAASLFAAAEETASISDCACEYALPEGWFEQLCGAADGLPGARAGEWAERQLAALYLAYVQAGLSGPDEMQAAREKCSAFFKAAWLPREGDIPPDLLFASYGETMDAAMRIDPEAESGYDPYPMFADILRMECD